MKGKKRVFLITAMLLILLITLVSAMMSVEFYCDVTVSDCQTAHSYMSTLEDMYYLDMEVDFYQFPNEDYDSMTAALALECADIQGMFDEYKDALIDEMSYSRTNLKDVAVELGMGYANFSFCLDSRERGFMLQEDIDRGVSVGVDIIPTMFIQGEKLEGLYEYEDYEAVVKEKLGLDEAAIPEYVEEEVEEEEEEVIEIVIEETDCTGCLFDDLCLEPGVRKDGMYCEYDSTMQSQREEGSACDNNYECSSNVCEDNICDGEELSFFGRIINFFKNLYKIE